MENRHMVFISLPMRGLTKDQIRNDILQARVNYLTHYRGSSQVIFVDNFFDGGPFEHEPYRHSVWCLGKALEKIAGVDEVFFYGKWKQATGCLIEYGVCKQYGILSTEYYPEEEKK